MTYSNLTTGQIGEKLACKFLQNKGYSILQTHFTTHWGELDIVARKGNKVSFIEVKTRVGTSKGKPYEAVTYGKLQRLKRPIQFFLLKNKLTNYKLSVDVIAIILGPDKTVQTIDLFENVWQPF